MISRTRESEFLFLFFCGCHSQNFRSDLRAAVNNGWPNGTIRKSRRAKQRDIRTTRGNKTGEKRGTRRNRNTRSLSGPVVL